MTTVATASKVFLPSLVKMVLFGSNLIDFWRVFVIALLAASCALYFLQGSAGGILDFFSFAASWHSVPWRPPLAWLPSLSPLPCPPSPSSLAPFHPTPVPSPWQQIPCRTSPSSSWLSRPWPPVPWQPSQPSWRLSPSPLQRPPSWHPSPSLRPWLAPPSSSTFQRPLLPLLWLCALLPWLFLSSLEP